MRNFLSPELTTEMATGRYGGFVSEFQKEAASRSEVVRRSGGVSTSDDRRHWPSNGRHSLAQFPLDLVHDFRDVCVGANS